MKNLSEIKAHWESWASTFGDDLRATTRSSNVKKLEIKALDKMIRKHTSKKPEDLSILEAGCGNGFNSISLAQSLGCKVDGFDFIEDMIDSAKSNLLNASLKDIGSVRFWVGDVLKLNVDQKYDVVFCCRCLINLPSEDMKNKAILGLMEKLEPNGVLILLENFSSSHDKQNDLREGVGLPRRDVAKFNQFFSYSKLLSMLSESNISIIDESNFCSLHDVIQYVLVPMISAGETDYGHDVMDAVTTLLLSFQANEEETFGQYGQNKLIVMNK